MVMSSSLTDGGLRDRVSRNPDHSLAKLYAACTGDPGDGSHRSTVKLSLVLVRESNCLELF